VGLTEAARWTWLGPLLAATLLSPFLVRLARFFVWRLGWNLAVVGVFALLVQHVSEAGVANLLEDGLLLAALCQVHLLNNISRVQKPDLLFFNSFLIAVVTSYLSLDVGYLAVLLLYAPLFVVALQLLVLVRAGAAGKGLVAAAVLSGVRRSLVVMAATFVVFFFLPRDTAREGLLGERLRFHPPGGLSEVAFSEEVNLDRSGRALSSDRVVLTVHVEAGPQLGVPEYWRGATMEIFDGNEWRGDPRVRNGRGGWRTKGGALVHGRGTGGLHVEVQLADPDASRFFAPLSAARFELRGSIQGVQVNPLPDGNLQCLRGTSDRRPVRYGLVLRGDAPARAGRVPPTTRANRAYVDQTGGAVPPLARDLARTLRGQLPEDAEQHEIVERMRVFLATRYRYVPPGRDGGARGLGDFLRGDHGGHCEYFATALAVLLRLERIPCRLVTGYRSSEWDEDGQTLTVRARHAHAWVEVLDPEAGWTTVDPTPASDAGLAGSAGVFEQVRAWAAGLWTQVTSFNDRALDGAYLWLGVRLARVRDGFRVAHAVLAAVVLAGAALAWRWRRRRRIPAAVARYRACLRRCGLALRESETPRELLRRADVAPERRAALEEATRLHEAHRYGVA